MYLRTSLEMTNTEERCVRRRRSAVMNIYQAMQSDRQARQGRQGALVASKPSPDACVTKVETSARIKHEACEAEMAALALYNVCMMESFKIGLADMMIITESWSDLILVTIYGLGDIISVVFVFLFFNPGFAHKQKVSLKIGSEERLKLSWKIMVNGKWTQLIFLLLSKVHILI